MAVTFFERWSPEYALNNTFDDMRASGLDGLKKHLTANALKVVTGFESLNGKPGVSLFTSALLGGDAVSFLLERLSGSSFGGMAFAAAHPLSLNPDCFQPIVSGSSAASS